MSRTANTAARRTTTATRPGTRGRHWGRSRAGLSSAARTPAVVTTATSLGPSRPSEGARRGRARARRGCVGGCWQDAFVERGRDGPGTERWGGSSRVVVRADDGIAELALLRRRAVGGDVLELVVDGVFAMDTEQTETERALAGLALDQLGSDDLHVVVGGLGLGYTTATLLADPRVARALAQLASDDLPAVVGGLGLGSPTAPLRAAPRGAGVDVVELHAPLVQWVREGLVPPARGLLDDPRVHVQVGDIADAVPG